MKVEKKLLMGITFIVALIVLLLVFYLITGFQSGLKDIITAVYFSLWITAMVGLWLYIIQPYVSERTKKKGAKQSVSDIRKPGPVPSPQSNLPLRDRIREYVTERRKEEGLPVPEPLRPSRTTGSSGKTSSASPGVMASTEMGVPAASVAAASVATAAAAATADLESGDGDLPLPDDFDESESGDLFGDEFPEDEGGEAALPGIDDEDFGSFDDTGVEEETAPDSGSLPDFEGDLEADMSDSEFSESLTDEFPAPEEPAAELEIGDEGGLSDEGLSDFDMPLDENMMDDDMSGDDDLADMDFEDLEPDEI
jgi:hypothetical protein